jgi:Na+/proline symporter
LSRLVASLTLHDCLELAALLAAISGILLLLSSAIARLAALRSAPRPDEGGMLLVNIRKFGILHMAVGGALFTLAEAVEMMT